MQQSVPPPFHVADDRGRRLRVRPASPDDTVADLARAVCGAPLPMRVDGTWRAPTERLVACPELVDGSLVALSPGGAPDGRDIQDRPDRQDGPDGARGGPATVGGRSAAVVTVVAGPACGRPLLLAPGRHGIGRSPALGISIDDPTVEPHQALLDVADDGQLTFTQVTGRTTIRIDDEPVSGTARVRSGAAIRIGASTIVVHTLADRSDDGLGGPSSRPASTGSVEALAADPWRRTLVRASTASDDSHPGAIAVPRPVGNHPRPPATPLIGAVCGVAGALFVATLLGQMLFAVFALLAALASLLTWLAGIASAARRSRRDRRRYADDVTTFRALLDDAAELARHHRDERHVGLGRTLAQPDLGFPAMWSRRVRDGSIDVVLGRGTATVAAPLDVEERGMVPVDLQPDVERAEHLPAVAIPITATAGEAIAIAGPQAMTDPIGRSLLVQLATWYGPADVALGVVTARPEMWSWVRWLPHGQVFAGGVLPSCDDDELAAGLDGADRGAAAVRVLVVDDPAALAARTGPLRRYLDRSGAICVAIGSDIRSAPAVCTRVLSVGSTGCAAWRGAIPASDRCWDLRPAGISLEVATSAARRMAHLVDPEDPDTEERSIPTRVPLHALEPGAAGDCPDGLTAGIAHRWRHGGEDPAPRAPVGRSADGIVEIDLVRDGPHGLVAGTTGAGKSELLRTLVVGLAARVSPDHLSFVLVDYKGGATFDRCVDLPHTVGLVTDLDDGLAARALTSLEAELRRRERVLRDAGAADLTAYRAAAPATPLARLVIVVDEFAVLAKEVPEFLGALVDVARRGRSLGVHLLLATQRPAGVVDDDIRANSNLRLALRLADAVDARDVIGDDRAAAFPREIPGRAALRLGADEVVVFQAASSGGVAGIGPERLEVELVDPASGRSVAPDPTGDRATPARRDRAARSARLGVGASACTELDRLVGAISAAAQRAGITPPPAPWIEPLPRHLDVDDVRRTCGDGAPAGVAHDAVGVLDVPAEQCRRPLRWDPAAGNLGLVGAAGTGRSSTLLSLATARCRVQPPEHCHLYVLDATGDPRYDALAGIDHCAAVIGLDERERLHRMLRRLTERLDAPPTGVDRRPRIVLVIDGLGAVRTALASLEDAPLLVMLDRLLADGPAAGIATAWSVDATSPAAAGTPAAQRWLFHLGDGSAVADGRARRVPAGVPGRLCVADSGLEGQVAAGAEGLAALPTGGKGGPPPVEPLPARIDPSQLAPLVPDGPAHGRGDSVILPVGRAFDDLATAALEIPAGDHVLIAGTSRTGVTSAVRIVAEAWQAARPHGRVIQLTRAAGRDPSPLADRRADGEPLLVIIDDAHRVDDTHGHVLAAIHGALGDVTVVAGGRFDALRAAYGHWTKEVARSRCGVLLSSTGEIDGDLLGVTLPRRTPLAARPGLGWVIDADGPRLVQLAVPRAGGDRATATAARPRSLDDRVRSER